MTNPFDASPLRYPEMDDPGSDEGRSDMPHAQSCRALNVLGQVCRLDQCNCWKAGL